MVVVEEIEHQLADIQQLSNRERKNNMFKWLGNTFRRVLNAPAADNVVYRDTCQANRDAQEQRTDDLKEHIDTRFNNLKDFISNNGFGKK